MGDIDAKQLVCYCINGHMQIPKGRYVPPTCPVCNASMDLNRMFIPPLASDTPGKDTVSQPTNDHEIESADRGIKGVQAPVRQTLTESLQRQSVPQIPLRRIPESQQIPGQSRASEAPQIPRRMVPLNIKESVGPDHQLNSQFEGSNPVFWLDFFGERIGIPPEGGWLGRSAIGCDHFDGNLLISREHVFVKPIDDQMLQIGPDRSLNGTFVDIGRGKKRLGENDTVNAQTGSVLWLYNIPLRLESKNS